MLFAMRGTAPGRLEKRGHDLNNAQFTRVSQVWIRNVRELEMTRFSLCSVAPGLPEKKLGHELNKL